MGNSPPQKQSAKKKVSARVGGPPTRVKLYKSWIELSVVDYEGNPIPNVPLKFKFTGSKGTRETTGTTDASGRVKVMGPKGKVEVTCDIKSATGKLLPTTCYVPLPHDKTEPKSRSKLKSPRKRPGKWSMDRYLELVRHVELAHPTWHGEKVLNAIRALAYGGPNFLLMYGMKARFDPKLKLVKETKAEAKAPRYLVQLETVVVKASDKDFASLAKRLSAKHKRHGTTPERLAEFNFGTADPKLVDLSLGAVVGCTRTNAQGNYVFSDKDAPGQVHVALPWSQKDLPTGTAHAILAYPCTNEPVFDKAQYDELEGATAHEFYKDTTQGVGGETGVVLDRKNELVGIGHMLCGLSAGQHRIKDHNIGAAVLGRKNEQGDWDMAKKKELGWGDVWDFWKRRAKKALSHVAVGENVDNLYAVTIAGDIGQTAVYYYVTKKKLSALYLPGMAPGKMTAYVGPGSELSFGEAVGDIDGFMMGEKLAILFKNDGGRSLYKQPGAAKGIRLSELLFRYYVAESSKDKPWYIHAGNRFRKYKGTATEAGILNTKELRSQTESFADNFGYKDRTDDGMKAALTEDYDDECKAAVNKFLGWLGRKARTEKP